MTFEEFLTKHTIAIVSFEGTEDWSFLGIDSDGDLAYSCDDNSHHTTVIEEPCLEKAYCKICGGTEDIGIEIEDINKHWEEKHAG